MKQTFPHHQQTKRMQKRGQAESAPPYKTLLPRAIHYLPQCDTALLPPAGKPGPPKPPTDTEACRTERGRFRREAEKAEQQVRPAPGRGRGRLAFPSLPKLPRATRRPGRPRPAATPRRRGTPSWRSLDSSRPRMGGPLAPSLRAPGDLFAEGLRSRPLRRWWAAEEASSAPLT